MKKVKCKFMSVHEHNGFSMSVAVKALKVSDLGLIPLLDAYNIEDLKLETNYFYSLVRSIIYQQLSSKAAKVIVHRFNNIFVFLNILSLVQSVTLEKKD